MSLPKKDHFRTLKTNAGIDQILNAIVDSISAISNDRKHKILANNLFDICSDESEYVELICLLAFKHSYFYPDTGNLQTIKTPLKLLRSGSANCVDYAVFLCSMCKIVGIDSKLKVVKFVGSDFFTHIYTLINGVSFDLVINQSQDGFEHLERKPFTFPVLGKEFKDIIEFIIIPIYAHSTTNERQYFQNRSNFKR